MSSSSSDENETTIHRLAGSGIYSQPRAGSSKRATRHDISDNEDEEEHYARFREEGVIEVDDAISVLLSSLHFEQKRDVVPNDEDDNRLRELHEKIFAIITNETDVHRRRRLKKTLSASNCVREQVFYLRRKPQNPPAAYYTRLNNALHSIVKESFGEEYRKVATVLGLVEALAEVLILEVQVFGMPEKEHGEHRTIRKLIANALTNLTFGQIHSKRKLCAYDGFIGCVVRIIIESPNITQVYAGLIRNLSWNADSGMSEALQPTVHALAIAAVYAHNHRYDVTAILSALWNLAGHSVENKRTICETRDCLKVLASLLSPDARFTSLVDSATGILKYVSQYLANTSTHLELRSLLITRMLSLLKSSSFTCVTNTLGAISNLIAKDPHMQQLIRHDSGSIQQLNVLRNSNRDDIRAAVKSVLNTLNQPMSSSHHRFGAPPPDMSLSVGASSSDYQQASPRLLSLRATRASPGRAQQLQIVAPDQRSSSLPRHFAVQRSQFMAMSYNGTMDQHMIYHMQQQQQMSSHVAPTPPTQQPVLYLPQYPPPQPPQVDEEEEDLEIPTSTVMCTRSNSEQSLGSLNPGSVGTTGGWNSTMGTEANTSRALSPVSYSDIPASPTMCAAQNAQNAQFLAQNSAQNAPNTTQHSNGSANTMTRSDGATTVPMDQLEHLEHLEHLVTPTYAILNPKAPEKELESPEDVLPGPPTMETGEYAVFDDDLLKRSIQSEKPSPRPQKMRVSPRLNGFFSPKEPAEPKNGRSDRRAEPIDDRSTEPGFEEQDLEDLEHNFEQEIDSSLPMDCCDEYYDDFDDYYEEEDPDATQFDEGVTIDCSMISNGSLAQGSALATSTPKGSTSSVTKRAVKSRLPVPRTNGSLVEKKKSMIPSAANHRPRLPPKPENLMKKEEIEEPESMENDTKDDTIYVNAPIVEEEKERIYMNALKQSSMSTPPPPQKSAIVTPYNYQKPHFSNRSTSELHTEKSVTPNPKQMLVTIV